MDFGDLLQRYVGSEYADAGKRLAAFAALASALKEALRDPHEATATAVAEAVRAAASPTMDLSAVQTLRRIQAKLPRGSKRLKMAVLGGFTTAPLIQGIELFSFARGLDVEIYSPEYGTFRQEILDPGSGLYRFAPSLVFVATSRRDVEHWPNLGEKPDSVADRIASELATWSRLWQVMHDRLGCQIVQNNFDPPPWRLLANRDLDPSSPGGYLARLNLALFDGAPGYVTIHDVDALSAMAGRWDWGDERYFYAAKLPCSPPRLVDYAHSVASVVAALVGKIRKCLVLDLDNTLWGGTIGDDGLAGIRVGPGNVEGEAYSAFQDYALGLGRRGVLLAICSKNFDGVAREVFEKHPGMKLRLPDIACFVANWEDKASNLRAIARTLNIGLDSLVFADDNPAERALVRQSLPMVGVPEMPADPAGYVAALERQRYFQVTSLTKEDLQRTEFYRADVLRKELEESSTDLEGFLRSLSMVAKVCPILPESLERAVQLINKSNQYNLTTRRYSNADLLTIVGDPRWVTLTASLADKFGDHGLITVVLGKVEGKELVIDTWLMSCRVLKRNVEHHLLNHLVQLARDRGLGSIRGEFIPTSKNALVEDHYARLGFARVGGGSDGRSIWQLVLRDSWSPQPSFIGTAQEAT